MYPKGASFCRSDNGEASGIANLGWSPIRILSQKRPIWNCETKKKLCIL